MDLKLSRSVLKFFICLPVSVSMYVEELFQFEKVKRS